MTIATLHLRLWCVHGNYKEEWREVSVLGAEVMLFGGLHGGVGTRNQQAYIIIAWAEGPAR